MSAASVDPSGAAGERRVGAALTLWAASALVLAASGVVASLPPMAVPVMIWSPVLVTVGLYRRSPSLRAFVAGVDLRVPVLYHLVRVLFGGLFLVEMRAGRLPETFAMIAGPGDIAAGLLSIPAAWLATRSGRRARTLVLAWNTLGLLDILAVFVTAQRMLFVEHDLRFFHAMRRMPYATLPVLVVPLVVLTHLMVFARLRGEDPPRR